MVKYIAKTLLVTFVGFSVFAVTSSIIKEASIHNEIKKIKSTSDIYSITIESYFECMDSSDVFNSAPGEIACQSRAISQVVLIRGDEVLPEARGALKALREALHKLDA